MKVEQVGKHGFAWLLCLTPFPKDMRKNIFQNAYLSDMEEHEKCYNIYAIYWLEQIPTAVSS